MNDDPKQLAEYLIQQHGSSEAALEIAVIRTAEANETGDYYALSIWREVKRILREGNDALSLGYARQKSNTDYDEGN